MTRPLLQVLALALLGPCIACPVHAQSRSDPLKAMPGGAWQALEQAPGIISGMNPKAVPRIQIVFDPDCPYSAEVYRYFKHNYPHTPIRWTPVAYMRADSYALALAIFSASDPRAALDVDLGRYDFRVHRGGFRLPLKMPMKTLGPTQRRLQQLWSMQWGAYTPMIFFRDSAGRVFKAETDLPKVLNDIAGLAEPPPLPNYP